MALFFDLYITPLLIGYFCLMFPREYLEQHEIKFRNKLKNVANIKCNGYS
jgi:hypothetical protein